MVQLMVKTKKLESQLCSDRATQQILWVIVEKPK